MSIIGSSVPAMTESRLLVLLLACAITDIHGQAPPCTCVGRSGEVKFQHCERNILKSACLESYPKHLNITELDLSSKGIEDLNRGVFDEFHPLTSLNLANNRLTGLYWAFFKHHPELSQLNLSGNPLDCSLDWCGQHHSHFRSFKNAICASPSSFSGVPFDQLECDMSNPRKACLRRQGCTGDGCNICQCRHGYLPREDNPEDCSDFPTIGTPTLEMEDFYAILHLPQPLQHHRVTDLRTVVQYRLLNQEKSLTSTKKPTRKYPWTRKEIPGGRRKAFVVLEPNRRYEFAIKQTYQLGSGHYYSRVTHMENATNFMRPPRPRLTVKVLRNFVLFKIKRPLNDIAHDRQYYFVKQFCIVLTPYGRLGRYLCSTKKKPNKIKTTFPTPFMRHEAIGYIIGHDGVYGHFTAPLPFHAEYTKNLSPAKWRASKYGK